MLSSALTRGRTLAGRLMKDACTVARPSAPTTNGTTFAVTPASTTVYTGKCQISTYEPQESERDVAGGSVSVQRYALKVPVESYAPQIGDVATITAAAFDGNLVDRKFRVVALLHKTAATAYRLSVEEVPTWLT